MHDWLILKLGGTSVTRSDYWNNAIRRIHKAQTEEQRVVIVHSAIAGVTDQLDSLWDATSPARARIVEDLATRHRELASQWGIKDTGGLEGELRKLKELVTRADRTVPLPLRAQILAMGEYLATQLTVPLLKARGLPVEAIDATEILVASGTNDEDPARHYLAAHCHSDEDPQLSHYLATRSPVIVTQGFVARDLSGATVVLGRGGSDTSAAYLAAKLQATALEIWTDVPGLFTADPNKIQDARLLRRLAYDEALEIAATGAKVLHPRCIDPVARANVPLRIRFSPDPDVVGTEIRGSDPQNEDRPKAVCSRRQITVLSIDNPQMWHQVGFLATIFAEFKKHAVSVDMISTSQASLTLTLDPALNPLAEKKMGELCRDLGAYGDVTVTYNCVAISIVGRRIRTNLHRIAPFLEVFEDRRVHLVSQSANDLNITFVVDTDEAPRLASELHSLLIGNIADDPLFGPTFPELTRSSDPAPSNVSPWWQQRSAELVGLSRHQSPCYVYDLGHLRQNALSLQHALTAVDRIFYSVKANHHPEVLRVLHECGLGFECVSLGELEHVVGLFPDIRRDRILFTPNFAPRHEYEWAFAQNVWVTVDNTYVLENWAESFSGHAVLLRIDPGHGKGHHRHVRTAGTSSKFGIPVADLPHIQEIAERWDITIRGLHAHAGSGIHQPDHWRDIGRQLAQLRQQFPDAEILDLGGGLGVPEHLDGGSLDLARVNLGLENLRAEVPGHAIWLEPGRALVADAGVLIARVTQIKGKGGIRYAGVDTGMNSLLRPALYGSYHPIVNLSHTGESSEHLYTVVGPICESGDVLGTARALPETSEGDTLLFANCGAYGRVMSSHYNLRQPAAEITLEDPDNSVIGEPGS